MYYIYELIDPTTLLPFYVGKGKGKRAQYHIDQNRKGKNTENIHKDNIIRQLLAEGLEPIINYVFWTEDENTAYEHEELLINQYGRKWYDKDGILTNVCEGNKPPKPEYTDERRDRYRQMMLGNIINKGRVQCAEEKAKRAKSLKEAYDSGTRVVTDAMRQATKETHTGKIVTESTRMLQSETAKINNAWKIGKTNEEIFGVEKANEIRLKKIGVPPPNRKPITVNGVTYSSIKEAAKALNTTEYKVKKLNDNRKI
jgi:hypothetical protein